MIVARGIMTLVVKDLRIEVRTRQTLGLLVVLGVLIIAVLALALPAQGRSSGGTAAAILWVAYLFSGVLCFERAMRVEREDDALAALLLSPVGPGAIYAAKLFSNLVMLLLLGMVLTPVGAILSGFDVQSPGSMALIVGLSMVGFASVGTLFSATPASASASGGMVPLLVFPLALPLVIASTRQIMEPAGGAGLAILIAFDLIFLVAGWLAFEFLLDA